MDGRAQRGGMGSTLQALIQEFRRGGRLTQDKLKGVGAGGGCAPSRAKRGSF